MELYFDFWFEHHADIYYQMLVDNCTEITENPDIGKDYERIVDLLFGFRSERHIIFYRKINLNEVEIIRFLHEQMDLRLYK